MTGEDLEELFVERAVKAISNYCKNTDCDHCRFSFNNRDYVCLFGITPSLWSEDYFRHDDFI